MAAALQGVATLLLLLLPDAIHTTCTTCTQVTITCLVLVMVDRPGYHGDSLDLVCHIVF